MINYGAGGDNLHASETTLCQFNEGERDGP